MGNFYLSFMPNLFWTVFQTGSMSGERLKKIAEDANSKMKVTVLTIMPAKLSMFLNNK